MTKNKTKKTKKPSLQSQLDALGRHVTACNAAVSSNERALDRKIATLRNDIDGLIGNYRGHGERLIALEAASGPTWKTATGTVLRMREMEDGHLSNAIKFLEKQVVSRNLDKKLDNAEWTAKWVPKLNELRDERARREKQKQESARWRNQGSELRGQQITGVVIDEVADRIGQGEASYEKNGERVDLPAGRYMLKVDGCTRAVLDSTFQALGRSRRVLNGEAIMPFAKLEQTHRERHLEQELKGRIEAEAKLAKSLDERDAKIHDLENQLAELNVDGNLAYWKRSAAARLETLLRLRQTVKVLRDEVQRLKAAPDNQRGDIALAKHAIRELIEVTEAPRTLSGIPMRWRPSSKAGRAEALAKRLALLFGVAGK
jgi:hypothetical protein